ncbi:hypothetical protein Scel_19200 [Streptomyces cellostaticus]|nr:hypothetical protein Scel_19200 [Streptomyces cellostaticus]
MRAARRRLGDVEPLSLLATGLLGCGYAWLGLLACAVPGALAGAALGILMSGMVHVAVRRAVSGPGERRRADWSGPCDPR